MKIVTLGMINTPLYAPTWFHVGHTECTSQANGQQFKH